MVQLSFDPAKLLEFMTTAKRADRHELVSVLYRVADDAEELAKIWTENLIALDLAGSSMERLRDFFADNTSPLPVMSGYLSDVHDDFARRGRANFLPISRLEVYYKQLSSIFNDRYAGTLNPFIYSVGACIINREHAFATWNDTAEVIIEGIKKGVYEHFSSEEIKSGVTKLDDIVRVLHAEAASLRVLADKLAASAGK